MINYKISKRTNSCLKMAFILPVVFLSIGLQAKNYYVDAIGGIDTNNGTTLSTPWKSISKVTSTTFAAGDSIL
jgi:hypothetical protein